MKKIFIAAPYTENFENGFLLKVESVLKKLNHEPIVPHKYATNAIEKAKDEIAFDFHLLDSSDIILAEVTKPSHGVGMEILYAHQKGKRVILMKKNGSRLSHMALVHAHEIIEYEDQQDLEKKLLNLKI